MNGLPMKMIWFSLLAVIVHSTIQIGLITSQSTPNSLLSNLASSLPGILREVEIALNTQIPFELISSEIDSILSLDEPSWTIPSNILDNNIQVILDAGFTTRYSNFLSDRCSKLNLLHVVMSRPINTLEDETAYPSTLYPENSYIDQGLAIYDIVSHFNWRNLGMVYDECVQNEQMASTIKAQLASPVEVKNEVILDNTAAIQTSSITNLLKSTTKDSGARVIVVMSDNKIAAQVLRAAEAIVMGGVGFAWILSSDAINGIGLTLKNSYINDQINFGVSETGAIGVRPDDWEIIQNEPLATYISVISLVGLGYLELGSPTGKDLRDFIMTNPNVPNLQFPLKFDKNGIKKVGFTIFNIDNYAEIKVGHWDPDSRQVALSEYMKIVWPGNSYSVPNDTIPIIQLGLLYPGHDNNGVPLLLGREILHGFNLDVNAVNSNPVLLNGYQIQPIFTDTFLLPSLAQMNLHILSSNNIVGYVGPHSLELCEAYSSAQTYLTDQNPMITSLASSTSLSDLNTFPYVLQVIQPDGLQAIAITLFIQLQGWKTIGVIYTNDDYGIGVYSSFLENIETLEITIANSEKDRVIDYSLDSTGNLTQATKDSIDTVLSQIVRGQVKVIIYLGNPIAGPQLAKTGFYKELHGSEYAWVGTSWLTSDILKSLNTTYAADKSAIMSVFEGAIGIDQRDAQGTVGTQYAASYFETYGETYSKESMLTYDAVLIYTSVLNEMIRIGDNYNSGTELINNLRAADLTGATGTIKFSEGSNSRSAYGYNIVNLQHGEIVEVLVYDPLNPNLFTVINNQSILWGGDSTLVPSDVWPIVYDCPFASHMSQQSSNGLGIIIGIGTFLFLLTLALSYFSYKKWRQIEIIPITSTVVRSWKDTLVQAQIAIEFSSSLRLLLRFRL